VSAPREFRHLPAINHTGLFWRPMGTRPDTSVRALRRRNDALLTIWLAFLDELDNPVRPRAAECRHEQEQWLRRDTSTRGLSRIRAVKHRSIAGASSPSRGSSSRRG